MQSKASHQIQTGFFSQITAVSVADGKENNVILVTRDWISPLGYKLSWSVISIKIMFPTVNGIKTVKLDQLII